MLGRSAAAIPRGHLMRLLIAAEFHERITLNNKVSRKDDGNVICVADAIEVQLGSIESACRLPHDTHFHRLRDPGRVDPRTMRRSCRNPK